MIMKKYFALMLLPLMAACSSKESFPEMPGNGPESFNVSVETVSKAEIGADLKPQWLANDQISVFANSVNQCYQTATAGSAVEFTFQTTENAPTPVTASMYYFAYPYNLATEIDGSTLSMSIPARQVAVQNGICPEAMLMAGKTADQFAQLYNCVALVKITLSDSDASAIVLTSNSGEKIAGNIEVSLSGEGAPAISCTGSSQVLLIPATGETLAAGTYYAAVAPTAVAGGLNALVIKGDNVFTASSTNALTFKRSEVMAIGDMSTTVQSQNTYKINIDFFPEGSYVAQFLDDKGVAIDFANSFSDGKTGTFANSEFNLYTKEENGGFQFSGFAKRGLGKNSNQGFRCLLSEEDYLRLPAINGMKLAAVRVLEGNGGYAPFAGIAKTSDGSFLLGAEAYGVNGNYITWYTPNAETGTSYDLKVKDVTYPGGMCGFKKIEVFYTGTSLPTVKAVKTGICKGSGTSAALNGSYTQFGTGSVEGITCGFEYREVGATDWTVANCESASAEFSKTVEGLNAEKQYEARAFVQNASVKLYGNATKLESANEYVVDFLTASSNWAGYFDNTMLPLPTSNTGNSNIVYPLVMLSGDHLTCEAMVNLNSGASGTTAIYINNGLCYQYSRRTSYLTIPAINGLTLTKVVVSLGAATSSGKFCLQKMDGTALTGDLTWTANADNTLTPSNLVAGEKAKLVTKNEKNALTIQKLVLSYSGVALPTVMYVCPPTVSGGVISSRIYVNTVTNLSNVSSGFEVKVGDDFTPLAGGSCTGSAGIVTATASSSVSSGSVIRAWSSVDGGTTKVYSPEYTVE